MERQWRPIHWQAIVLRCDTERLAQAPGPTTQEPEVIKPTTLSHDVEPRCGLKRPDEDCVTCLLSAASEIQAPVKAIRAVDVRPPRRAEHRGIPSCLSHKVVGRRVIPGVGFRFDNDPSDAAHKQGGSDEIPRHLYGVACEERWPQWTNMQQ